MGVSMARRARQTVLEIFDRIIINGYIKNLRNTEAGVAKPLLFVYNTNNLGKNQAMDKDGHRRLPERMTGKEKVRG